MSNTMPATTRDLMMSQISGLEVAMQAMQDGLDAIGGNPALAGDVAELQTTVGQMQTDLTALENTVASMDVGSMQASINQLQTDLAALQTTVGSLDGGSSVDLAPLQNDIAALQNDVATLQSQLASLSPQSGILSASHIMVNPLSANSPAQIHLSVQGSNLQILGIRVETVEGLEASFSLAAYTDMSHSTVSSYLFGNANNWVTIPAAQPIYGPRMEAYPSSIPLSMPYQDQDGTDKLHLTLYNNSGQSHTFKIHVLYMAMPDFPVYVQPDLGDVPLAPTLTVSNQGADFFDVQIQAGDADTTGYTKYQVWMTMGESGTGHWSDYLSAPLTSVETISFTHMSSDTYSVKVRAVNAAGVGAESDLLTVDLAAAGGGETTSTAGWTLPEGVAETTSTAGWTLPEGEEVSPPEGGEAEATAPDVPTAVSVASMSAGIMISFTEPANNGGSAITGYEAKLESSSSYFTVSNGSIIGEAEGLSYGTVYGVQVRAVNAAMLKSDWSSPVYAAAGQAPTAAPSVTLDSVTETSISFYWSGASGGSGATGHEYSINGVDWVALSGSPVTISDLSSGTEYTVRVRGFNAVGPSPEGTLTASTTSAATVPDAPTDVSAASVDAGIYITYTVPVSDGGSEITGFEATVNGGSTYFPLDSLTIGETEGLTYGNSYDIQVRAVNAEGASAWSEPAVSAVAGTAPTVAPTINVTAVASDSITFEWTPATGGTSTGSGIQHSYTIDNGVSFTLISVSPVTISDLNPDTEYTVRVQGSNLVGASPASEETVTTAVTVPDAPTITSITWNAANEQATLNWTPPANNNGILQDYQYSINGGVDWTTLTGSASGTSYLIEHPADTSRDYLLRAINSGGPSVASVPFTLDSTSAPEEPAVPETPVLTEATWEVAEDRAKFVLQMSGDTSNIEEYWFYAVPAEDTPLSDDLHRFTVSTNWDHTDPDRDGLISYMSGLFLEDYYTQEDTDPDLRRAVVGKTYGLRVRAKYTDGTLSGWSNWSSFTVTSGTPSMVRVIGVSSMNATDTTDYNINVHYQQPVNNGSDITQYEVKVYAFDEAYAGTNPPITGDGALVTEYFEGANPSIVVSMADHVGTTVVPIVRAINSAGWSDPSVGYYYGDDGIFNEGDLPAKVRVGSLVLTPQIESVDLGSYDSDSNVGSVTLNWNEGGPNNSLIEGTVAHRAYQIYDGGGVAIGTPVEFTPLSSEVYPEGGINPTIATEITGLAAGSYLFKVLIANTLDYGDGSSVNWSDSGFSDEAKVGAPTTPLWGSVTSLTHNSAEIPYSESTGQSVVRYRYKHNGSWRDRGNVVAPVSLSGLGPNTEYTLHIEAYNSVGVSGRDSITFTTQALVPSMIINGFGRPRTESELTGFRIFPFTAPDDHNSPITGYQVSVENLDGTGTFSYIDIGASAAWNGYSFTEADGIVIGDSYVVNIRAVNSAGPGPWMTNSSIATVAGLAPTGFPTVDSVTPTSNSVVVNWTGSSEGSEPLVYEYRIFEVGTDPDAPNSSAWALSATEGEPLTISGLTPNTAYEVQFRATNPVGSTLWTFSEVNRTQFTTLDS